MEEQGYSVTVIPGGGVGVEGASGERESMLANDVCLQWYPYRVDVIQLNLDDQSLAVHYGWTVNEIIPCLSGLGLDTETPPALEEFVAIYRADEPMWFPGDYSPQELETINASCPLLPPIEDVLAHLPNEGEIVG